MLSCRRVAVVASSSSRMRPCHGVLPPGCVARLARTRRLFSSSSRIAAASAVNSVSTNTTTTTTTTTSPLWGPLLLPTKVLIANRGEIACRVARTCRRLGIPTVAIYSVADGPNALHARMCDEALLIGSGPAPAESYLLQDEVIRIAQLTGATAIHPGYGFLSENASFVQKLPKSIQFIGPPASAMTAMASKSQSKAIMEAAGVPTTPGYYSNSNNDSDNKNEIDEHQNADFLLHKAIEIGFPVLIKAVMGGGGKGMRLVWHESDFKAALQACRGESLAAFGDDRVLLEKYLVRPRHVEVQVIADTHGNVVHLYERDCSLQRRHQKIIEEAPGAADLPPSLRQRLGDMGTRAAAAVGYVNAGTVEFLLDTTTTTKDESQEPAFYFCEMNTRLQVEHPITELITGIDLVEWQLRIAAGQELPVKDQSQIPCHGHAFEARIYAENPARHFLPATGKLFHHAPPCPINTGLSAHTGIRCDTGVTAGSEIGVYYDPMISKLIVHDQDRPAALQKLIGALKSYQIAGVDATNIDFLIQCAQHAVFGSAAGAVNTGFLEDYAADIRVVDASKQLPSALAQAVGSYIVLLYMEQRLVYHPTITSTTTHKNANSPWSSRQGSWRVGGDAGRARRTLHLVLGNGDDNDSLNDKGIECKSNRDGSFEIRPLAVATTTTTTSSSSKSKADKHHHPQDDKKEKEEWIHVTGEFVNEREMEIVVNHTQRFPVTVVVHESNDNDNGNILQVRMWPKSNLFTDDYFWQLDVKNPLRLSSAVPATGAAAGAGAGTVKSPMPGKIRRVNFAVGDMVQEGEVVMVMEAMKMEHAIKASRSGILKELRYKTGDVVKDGVVLLRIVVVDEKEDGPAVTAA